VALVRRSPFAGAEIECATFITPTQSEKQQYREPAISQGGLDLWLEQASDFFAGRQRCI
jgi:hypothetical protein